jgi:cell division protease FtsH
LAARRDKPSVTLKEMEEAIDRVIAGPERKSRMMSEKEKKVIAYHESGHTLIARLLPGTDPVHKVSIIPRGPALGYTLQLPTEDKYLTTKSEMLNRLCVLLGGRTAEETVFNESTTGAQDDLQKATHIATRMVCEFGMSDKIGLVAYKKRESETFLGRDIGSTQGYSDQTAQSIDEEIKSIIAGCQDQVRKLLTDNRAALDALAAALMEREVLDGDNIDRLIKGEPLPPLEIAEDKPSKSSAGAAGDAAAPGLNPAPTPA